MDFSGSKGFFVCIFLSCQPLLTGALSCYQCNVFVRGTPWPCDSERGMKVMDNCTACLKSYTRSYLHNTFHDQLLSTYISRVCVKDRHTARDAGCHNQVTDSGYMKRCFCYDDLCNHSPPSAASLSAMFGSLVLTFVLKLTCA